MHKIGLQEPTIHMVSGYLSYQWLYYVEHGLESRHTLT